MNLNFINKARVLGVVFVAVLFCSCNNVSQQTDVTTTSSKEVKKRGDHMKKFTPDFVLERIEKRYKLTDDQRGRIKEIVKSQNFGQMEKSDFEKEKQKLMILINEALPDLVKKSK